MKALVTGGGGFLGGRIVRLLRERGATVRSYSRGAYPALDQLGVEQISGDLADFGAIDRAVDGCDIVFHVAAKAGVWGPWSEYFHANVSGTNNVVAACRKRGVGRLVFTSSPSVTFAGVDQNGVDESEPYPDQFLAHYPHSKSIAEKVVLNANDDRLATVSLRPHLIWGPGDPHLFPRLVARARQGRLKRIGKESKLIDTTHVDNAAIAHLQAADRLAPGSPVAGKAYFISQGEPEPTWDFINRVLEVYQVPAVTKSVPTSVAYMAGRVLEWAFRLLPGEPPMTRFVARQLSTAHWFDLSAARRDFGYAPTITTAEGLRQLAESLQS